MKQESLIKLREIILDELVKAEIDPVDKAELSINLYHFLHEDDYEDNVKVLRRYLGEKRNGIMD